MTTDQLTIVRILMMTTDQLTTERDNLLAKLEQRWRWLDNHPDHPQYRQREDAVLVDLKAYEDIEDALAAKVA